MRISFINELIQIAKTDKRIWLVTGDLGYSVLEKFEATYPDRYINAGVAEQNMTGLASGLAIEGNIVFTYSIANFPTIRCLEQIRNDVCYHNANVKIVSVGSGYSYGSAGYTHHGIEDLGIMRLMPNMVIFNPGDPTETVVSIKKAIEHDGPCYIRLGKSKESVVHGGGCNFEIGKGIILKKGHHITMLTTGTTLKLASEFAYEMSDLGIEIEVLSMPALWPFDEELMLESITKTNSLITIEEHSIGGLSTIASEIIARNHINVDFHPLFLGKSLIKVAGSQEYLREKQGISYNKLTELSNKIMSKKNGT